MHEIAQVILYSHFYAKHLAQLSMPQKKLLSMYLLWFANAPNFNFLYSVDLDIASSLSQDRKGR